MAHCVTDCRLHFSPNFKLQLEGWTDVYGLFLVGCCPSLLYFLAHVGEMPRSQYPHIDTWIDDNRPSPAVPLFKPFLSSHLPSISFPFKNTKPPKKDETRKKTTQKTPSQLNLSFLSFFHSSLFTHPHIISYQIISFHPFIYRISLPLLPSNSHHPTPQPTRLLFSGNCLTTRYETTLMMMIGHAHGQ